MEVIIGIDIGGSLVRVGATDIEGKLLALREAPIEARQGPEAGLKRIAGLIESLLKDEGMAATPEKISLMGIGIGCSGPVDPERGVVNNPYTLPTWENVPLGPWLEQHFQVPTRLENDADVAALGEYWQGAGKGVKRLYAVTVGTGIGTAMILNGQIYRGLDGCHPEGGHQVIDPRSGVICYCRVEGCWESLASGSAIARMAREAVEASQVLDGESIHEFTRMKASELRASCLQKEELESLDARRVVEAALQGDPLARKVIEKAAFYLSLGVLNVVLLFTPDMIVLSGGVMENVMLFMPTLEETMQRHNLMVPADRVVIRQAELGSHAGVYGAAYTILQRLTL
jgi:glucokinase